MEHQKSKVLVYQTTNYKLFKFLDGNRPTTKTKKARIMGEIKAGNDILDEVPILVKEQKNALLILDGQNRFEIAEELKRPVHYIVKKENMSMLNVARVNSNVEKWTSQDFINCYKQNGNDNYKKVADFHKKYGIAIGITLLLLHKGDANDSGTYESLMQQFQMGTFEVKKLKEATQIAEICKSFEAFKGWNSRGFVVAVCKILDNGTGDFDVLLKKFSRDPSRLKNHSNWKGYASNLQEIYNIDNSKQRLIF